MNATTAARYRNEFERLEPQLAGAVRSRGVDEEAARKRVIAALRTVYDPEIPLNIYDLGLVYKLDVCDAGVVHIRMTLTAPGCPVAQTFPGVVEQTVNGVPGVAETRVDLVWDPPWSREMMSEPARLELGMF